MDFEHTKNVRKFSNLFDICAAWCLVGFSQRNNSRQSQASNTTERFAHEIHMRRRDDIHWSFFSKEEEEEADCVFNHLRYSIYPAWLASVWWSMISHLTRPCCFQCSCHLISSQHWMINICIGWLLGECWWDSEIFPGKVDHKQRQSQVFHFLLLANWMNTRKDWRLDTGTGWGEDSTQQNRWQRGADWLNMTFSGSLERTTISAPPPM